MILVGEEPGNLHLIILKRSKQVPNPAYIGDTIKLLSDNVMCSTGYAILFFRLEGHIITAMLYCASRPVSVLS